MQEARSKDTGWMWLLGKEKCEDLCRITERGAGAAPSAAEVGPVNSKSTLQANISSQLEWER